MQYKHHFQCLSLVSSVSDVDGNCMSAQCDGTSGNAVLKARDCEIHKFRSCENGQPGKLWNTPNRSSMCASFAYSMLTRSIIRFLWNSIVYHVTGPLLLNIELLFTRLAHLNIIDHIIRLLWFSFEWMKNWTEMILYLLLLCNTYISK